MMKKVLSLFLLGICISIMSNYTNAHAAEKRYGDFGYTLSDNKITITEYKGSASSITVPSRIGGLQVTAIGAAAFANNNIIREVILSDQIESIGREAFYNCNKLKDINLPQGLTLIDERGFYGCESLADVELPDSLIELGYSAFYGCKSLSGIEFHEGLTSLKFNTFYGCSRIKSVTLPASLIEYDNPFTECTSLKEILVASSNESFISDYGILYSKDKTRLYCCPPAYPYEYAIPSDVTCLMNGAFASQHNLSEIIIPDSVTSIGLGAFYNASSVTSIELPENTLETIDGYSFSGSGIEELIIPEGVEVINGAFFGCHNLQRISLPTSLTFISPDESIGVFYQCENLERITVAEGNRNYFSEAGVLFQKKSEESNQQFLMCYPAAKSGKTYKLPKDTYLWTCAFDSCKYLRNVIIPEGIKSVFMIASNCRNLTITIPKSVIAFPPEGHIYDFPLLKNCTDCYIKVYKGSKSYEYCKRNNIPYKLIKS